MKRDNGPLAEGAPRAGRSVIRVVRQLPDQAQEAESALAEWCRSYRYRLSDAFAGARRFKREGGEKFVPLDAEDAEGRYRREPFEFLTAEKMFDVRRAMTVLGEALSKLRQEDGAAGKASKFETLGAFLESNNSSRRWRIGMGVASPGSRHPSIVAKSVHRIVASGGRPNPAEVGEEIDALVASEGRLGP